MNLPSSLTRVHNDIARATRSAERVLEGFLTLILPNIGGEQTREGLIDIHRLVSGNEVTVVLKFGGGRHQHLAITMTLEE